MRMFEVLVTLVCVNVITTAQTTQPARVAKPRPAATTQPTAAETAQKTTSPQDPNETPRARSAAAALRHRIDQLALDDAPLEAALPEWGRRLQVDVVANWRALEQAGVRRDTRVSLRVRSVTGEIALCTILQVATSEEPLAYSARGNIVYVSTAHEIDAMLITRIYDITSLVFVDDSPIPDPNTWAVKPFKMGFGAFDTGRGEVVITRREGLPFDARFMASSDENERRQIRTRQLIQAIMSLEPEHWQENGGPGKIALFRDKLIIHASPRIHQMIGGPVHDEQLPTESTGNASAP